MKQFTSSMGRALSLSLLSLSTSVSAAAVPRQASNFSMPIDGANTTTLANGTVVNQPQTLLPAVHWEYPVDDIRNLAPINTTDLYYSANGVSDPEVKHLFASMSATLQYEAVVLDHSSYVKNITCDTDGIHVDFTSPEGFHFAANSWPDPTDFVLVTYTDGCGASSNQRTFWLIDDITPLNATNSILAVVREELAIEDALGDVELVWGTYHPPGANATNATSVTGSSDTATNGDSCGAAPGTTEDGFPTADCGVVGFDQKLDDALGYQTLGNGSLGSFAPNVATQANQRRGLLSWIKDTGKKIGDAVKSGAQKVGDAVKQGVDDVTKAGKDVVQAGKSVASALTINPHISKSADINVFPPASAAPWPNAFKLFEDSAHKGNLSGSVALYCVDCGVKGHVTVAGSAKWGPFSGLQDLNTQINANIQAGVKLGIDAQAGYSKTYTKTLMNQAIPDLGFSVDKVFSAGVFVEIDATATLDIDAEAKILAGVTMSLPSFAANLNIKDQDAAKSSSVTGATPQWDKVFEADGEVTATAVLSLPISLNIGVEIVPIKFKKSVALIEKPNLTGKVTAAGSIGGGAPASQTCNDGVEWSLTAGNDIDLNLFDIKTFNLEHYVSPPLFSGCKQIPGAVKKTTTAVATTKTPAASASKGSSKTEATHTTGAVTPGGKPPVTTGSAGTAGTATLHTTAKAPTSTGAHNATSSHTTVQAPGYGGASSSSSSKESSHTTAAATTVAKPPSYGSETPSSKTTAAATTVAKPPSYGGEASSSKTSSSSSSSSSTSAAAATTAPSTYGSNTGVPATYGNSGTVYEYKRDATNTTGSDDVTYVSVKEIHDAFQLVPGSDGNLYTGTLANSSSAGEAVWASFNNVIVGDKKDRLLYFYPDVMAAYNVSRIRLGAQSQIPKGAQSISLIQNSDVQNAHFAATTNGESFGLVKCDFTNGADSKVFVANNANGPDTLKTEKLRYTVTGAPVQDCQWLALVTSS